MKSVVIVLSLAMFWIEPTAGMTQQTENVQNAAAALIRRHDKNADGKLSEEEFPKNVARLFRLIDKNQDGFITLEEDVAFRQARARQPGNNRPGNANPQQRGLPEGATVHRDLIYGQVGERKLPLDLYLPPKAMAPVPVVMWIHGGGWRTGSKGGGGSARPLLERGYALVDVEYRLSGEAIFPAQVEDCKAAVRWIRAHAKQYHLDAEHIGVWGSSAGGHLSAFVGTSGDVKEFDTDSHSDCSSRVQAVCDWFGPTDLLQMNAQAIAGATLDHDAPGSPESRLVGGPIQEEPFRSLAVKANPITYVTKDDPPFLIVHGDKDLLVGPQQSQLLHDALTKIGVPSKLVFVKNGGHGFTGGETSRQELFDQAADFFDQHLKPKK